MESQKIITIADVARAAGVSIATVSRFLRGESVRTAAAVEEAVDRLGYRPAVAARSLRSGIHYVIAMIVPDIANPYFSALAKGVESVFRDTPYRVFLCNTDEREDLEDAVLDEVARRVDGIILAPSVEREDAPTRLRKQGVPVILVDRELADKTFDSVLIDNGGGARSAAQHLCELGHTKIAIVSGSLANTPGRVRYSGFMTELEQRGIFPPKSFIQFSNFKESGGREAIQKLMQLPDPPTAVFCANNAMMVGALKMLKEMGVVVGRDLSVIGFDDLDLGSLLNPPVTVVDRPSEEQGVQAARLLLKRLSGGAGGAPEHIVLGTKLIVRASCVPPPTISRGGDKL